MDPPHTQQYLPPAGSAGMVYAQAPGPGAGAEASRDDSGVPGTDADAGASMGAGLWCCPFCDASVATICEGCCIGCGSCSC